MYNCLIKLIDNDDSAIREKVLLCLTTMRANHLYQLSVWYSLYSEYVQLDGLLSPYLKCHSQNVIRTISFVLPISNLIDALVDRAAEEKEYHVC